MTNVLDRKSWIVGLTGVQSKSDYIQSKWKNGPWDVGVIDVVGDSGQYESKRVTGNEGWYSAFYKDNKKAPSVRDVYDIAYREAMEEAQNSNDPEAKAAADTMTALMEKLETLEGLEEKVKSMDTKDIMARTLLDQEAFEKIYTPAVQALMKGNPAIQEAARDSALVNARVAQAFHEAYGEPYENIAKIVMGEDSNGYGQAMFDVRRAGLDSLTAFYDRILKGRAEGQPENKIKYTSQSGVIFSEERVMHAVKKHDLTRDDLEDIEEHINELHHVARSIWKQGNYIGQYNGYEIIGRIDGERGHYYVSLEFDPNGYVWFSTAVKSNKEAIDKKIDERNAGLLSHKGAVSAGHSSSISISMIKKELRIVNQTYNQLAGEKALTADRLKLQQAQVMEGGVPFSMENSYFQSGTWGDVAEKKLQKDEKRLSKTVDEFMEGKILSGFIPVMQTPLVMQLIGAAPYPVEISAKNLQTTLKGKHANEIDAELFKQLPRALSNPLMIFENRYTGASHRIVVLVDLKNKFGANIVVPLELSIDSHEKKYKINRIIDPFGRMDKHVNIPSYDWFAERVESKGLLYINKKRTSQWLRSEPPEWLLPDKSKKGLSLTIEEKTILSIRGRQIFKDSWLQLVILETM